jgi:hypothetical protein
MRLALRMPVLTDIYLLHPSSRAECANWGILMTLLGTHSARMILATGTPYNNKIGDLAALCAYYNVKKAHKQNDVKWWERAFKIKNAPEGEGAKAKLTRELEEWRANPSTGGRTSLANRTAALHTRLRLAPTDAPLLVRSSQPLAAAHNGGHQDDPATAHDGRHARAAV